MNEALTTWRGPVLQEWTDYNGHLRDAYYLLIFSYASDGFMACIGLDEAGREASGHSLFTLECHLNFLHEVKQGKTVVVQTRLLDHDHKRVHLYHSLHLEGADTELAASEQLLLHVTLEGPRATPFAAQTAQALRNLADREPTLPRPIWVGRAIALPNTPIG